MSKYRNTKVTFFGENFDSRKEAERWLILREREKNGEIRDLKRQVRFELLPKMSGKYRTERGVSYIADFCYYDAEGTYHVEDVKSEYTHKLKDYRLKRKMMLYHKGISIEEVEDINV